LIEAFDHLLQQAGPVCAQRRGHERLRAHLLAQLVGLGEHTISGLLCTTARQFSDWTADYRFYAADRVDPQPLFHEVRRGVEARLAQSDPLVVALDDSLLYKRGRKIPGTAWRRDPLGPPFHVNFVWAQRVVQLAAVLPEGTDGAARTLPIDFVQAPSAPRPREGADEAAWNVFREEQKRLNLNLQAVARLQSLVAQRQAEGQTRPLWVTVDGRFTNRTFLKNAPPQAVLIGRIRGDARLHRAPSPADPSTRGGHPRWYGPALPTPEQIRQQDAYPYQTVEAFAAGRRHAFRIKTVSDVRWRVAGAKRPVRLLVIAPLGYRLHQGGRVLYRKPAYLICTDPNQPIEQVLQAYLWRWGIEVNFRDQKTLLGVGQARVRNPASAARVPALAVAAYALLLLSAAHTKQLEMLPLPAWRRRAPPPRRTTAQLINQLRVELWADSLRPGYSDFTSRHATNHNAQKPIPNLESAVFYALAG
jgi:hypothetical protein